MSLCTSAQAYIPTVTEGANWVIQDSETPHFPYTFFVRTLEGDTVVDGRTYKKFYQHIVDYVEVQFGPPLELPYEVFPGRELIALLREDTVARRVYGIVHPFNPNQFSSPVDTLLHDYSLGIGDTLAGLNFCAGGQPAVLEVGAEMYRGRERRYQGHFGLRFYEGIGSTRRGPLSGGCRVITGGNFSVRDYCVGAFSDCNIVSSTLTLPGNVEISVFPNPFTDIIRLELPNGTPANPISATLRDLTGRVVKTTALTTELNWPVADVPAGVYLLTVSDGRANRTVKLVKQ